MAAEPNERLKANAFGTALYSVPPSLAISYLQEAISSSRKERRTNATVVKTVETAVILVLLTLINSTAVNEHQKSDAQVFEDATSF